MLTQSGSKPPMYRVQLNKGFPLDRYLALTPTKRRMVKFCVYEHTVVLLDCDNDLRILHWLKTVDPAIREWLYFAQFRKGALYLIWFAERPRGFYKGKEVSIPPLPGEEVYIDFQDGGPPWDGGDVWTIEQSQILDDYLWELYMSARRKAGLVEPSSESVPEPG